MSSHIICIRAKIKVNTCKPHFYYIKVECKLYTHVSIIASVAMQASVV